MALPQLVLQEFTTRFDAAPTYLVRAPGRVNLIGEHTDYNGGYVMPLAIDRAVWLALRPRTDGQVVVYSLDFLQTASFALNMITRGEAAWIEYLKGVAWVLQDQGYSLTGWEGVLAGNIPIGAGLSSSAALELATARAFAALGDWEWAPTAMALVGQHAENKWVGVNCGIMDQMISAAGRADHALLIDCQSLETTPVPLPPETVVVVMDTATRRGLVDTAYNERRAQCEAAARFFGVATLREVSHAQFEARSPQLAPLPRQRARHVITENERVLQAVMAMHGGDAHALGQLMNASHLSLRDDFEVSNAELNTMVELAQHSAVCYGARMTGAGFGGCAVALVYAAHAEQFVVSITEHYRATTGHQPSLYICRAVDGAEARALT